jgi:hypothetical protein
MYNQSKRTSKVVKVNYYSENDNCLESVNYWAVVCSFLHKVISLFKIWDEHRLKIDNMSAGQRFCTVHAIIAELTEESRNTHGKKPVPVLHCPPEIPYLLPLDLTPSKEIAYWQ